MQTQSDIFNTLHHTHTDRITYRTTYRITHNAIDFPIGRAAARGFSPAASCGAEALCCRTPEGGEEYEKMRPKS